MGLSYLLKRFSHMSVIMFTPVAVSISKVGQLIGTVSSNDHSYPLYHSAISVNG
jgi:hypothetical protein